MTELSGAGAESGCGLKRANCDGNDDWDSGSSCSWGEFARPHVLSHTHTGRKTQSSNNTSNKKKPTAFPDPGGWSVLLQFQDANKSFFVFEVLKWMKDVARKQALAHLIKIIIKKKSWPFLNHKVSTWPVMGGAWTQLHILWKLFENRTRVCDVTGAPQNSRSHSWDTPVINSPSAQALHKRPVQTWLLCQIISSSYGVLWFSLTFSFFKTVAHVFCQDRYPYLFLPCVSSDFEFFLNRVTSYVATS